jgi:hypothetical protein
MYDDRRTMLFDAAEGLYWYCVNFHAGQASTLYSVLSRLHYTPAPRERDPRSEIAQHVYAELDMLGERSAIACDAECEAILELVLEEYKD